MIDSVRIDAEKDCLPSDVMRGLGTSSRFDAGVRAAELGWLD
ncbi:hypothetical protein ACIRYZ_27080 [Kitasatospora sp. NPDC101155]